jgi:hypothetical protein
MLTSDSRWALQGSNLRPPPCKSDTTRDPRSGRVPRSPDDLQLNRQIFGREQRLVSRLKLRPQHRVDGCAINNRHGDDLPHRVDRVGAGGSRLHVVHKRRRVEHLRPPPARLIPTCTDCPFGSPPRTRKCRSVRADSRPRTSFLRDVPCRRSRCRSAVMVPGFRLRPRAQSASTKDGPPCRLLPRPLSCRAGCRGRAGVLPPDEKLYRRCGVVAAVVVVAPVVVVDPLVVVAPRVVVELVSSDALLLEGRRRMLLCVGQPRAGVPGLPLLADDGGILGSAPSDGAVHARNERAAEPAAHCILRDIDVPTLARAAQNDASLWLPRERGASGLSTVRSS